MPEDLQPAIHAVRSGDERAFRELYRAIQPGLLRYLQLLVGTGADAVASETWRQIARDLHSFKGDGAGFRRWAVTVGRSRAMDHLRGQSSPPVSAAHIATAPITAAHTAASVGQTLSTDDALALIAALPREQAEAVLLRVVIGLDTESAAEVLGKRPGVVRAEAHQGLRTLNELLLRRDGRGRGDTGCGRKV